MKEQMQLFSWLVKLQGDQAPDAKSKDKEPRKFVPEVAVVVQGSKACIAIQTGSHVEKFRLHTKTMGQDEFRSRAYDFAKQLLAIFRGDEIFLRRILAERGVEKQIRTPAFVNSGPLYALAVTELNSSP
jgi:hypothetical protein